MTNRLSLVCVFNLYLAFIRLLNDNLFRTSVFTFTGILAVAYSYLLTQYLLQVLKFKNARNCRSYSTGASD